MFYFSDKHEILPAIKREVNELRLEIKLSHIDEFMTSQIIEMTGMVLSVWYFISLFTLKITEKALEIKNVFKKDLKLDFAEIFTKVWYQ